MPDAVDALYTDLTTTEQLHGSIRTKATDLELDPALALSLAHQESGFNPQAKSPTGVEGLYQVTNATGAPYGQTPATRTDADVSTHAGLSYLKDLLKAANGNVRQALTWYNGGSDPHFADNVLRHYPLHAAASTTPGDELDALAREIGLTKPAPPQTTPTSSDVSSDVSTPEEAAQAVQRLRSQGQGAPGQEGAPPPGMPLAVVPAETPQPQTTVPSDLVIDIEKQSPATSMHSAIADLELLKGVPTSVPSAPPGITAAPTVREPEDEAREQRPFTEKLKDVAKLVLSTGTYLAAGTGGAAVLGVPGEILGLYLARKFNVWAGLEEPGMLGDVAAVALPLGARALPAAWRAALRQAPGASGVAHDAAQTILEQVPGRFAPPTASDVLFQRIAGQNPAINGRTLWQTSADIYAHELSLQPAYREPRLLHAAQDMLGLMRTYGNQIPLQVLNDYRRRLGLMIETASREQGPQVEGLRRLYGAIYTDLERAATRGVPGAQGLREALGAYRQEAAMDQLAHLWSPGRGIQMGAGNVTQVNGRQILNQFDRLMTSDQRFAGSFTPQEAQEIRTTLEHVARLTARSPTDPGLLGPTLRWGARTVGLGTIAHGEPAVGVAIEVAGEVTPYLIAAALRTTPGRIAVQRAFAEGGGVLTSAGLALIQKAVEEALPAGRPAGMLGAAPASTR